ncbi:hypothetical protein P7H09_11780 [Paenibacillus larvae]|uniref:Uncharacterized protein n=1 Tax=Paenibacillus larvae TaxID=1464 RepID=A0AAP5JTY7_9BACL|nr:hypothetical protein [Paenibacillus larvae]MDT2251936.1 hypothetical protein [Paenibacillus larvae]
MSNEEVMIKNEVEGSTIAIYVYGTAILGFISASVAIVIQPNPGYVTGWKESV